MTCGTKMCIICNDENYELSQSTSGYYFTCVFNKIFPDEKPVPTVFLCPKEYFDYHECCFDDHINLKFKWFYAAEVCEGQFEWDDEEEATSVLQMYTKMIEWGFDYSPQFVDFVAGYEEPGMALTSEMVQAYNLSKMNINN